MHNSKKTIKLCFIEDIPSIKEGILYCTEHTKSSLKKFNLNKNFLNKKILAKDEIELPIEVINHKRIHPTYTGKTVTILHENEFFIALSKPEKVHCHPLDYSDSNNLLSYLYSTGKYNKELQVNKQDYDRGLLNRLDYETSGIIFYIKHESLLAELRENMESLVKEKVYLAVVDGLCEYSGLLTQFLYSSGKKNHYMQISDQPVDNSEKVSCEVEVLSQNKQKNLSLLKVSLHQGKRHQIRKQLEGIRHTILGDPLYGLEGAKRMYLHAYEYSIVIDGKDYTVKDENIKSFLEFFDFDGEL